MNHLLTRSLLAVAAVAFGVVSCSLFVEFDESKIPTTAEAGVDSGLASDTLDSTPSPDVGDTAVADDTGSAADAMIDSDTTTDTGTVTDTGSVAVDSAVAPDTAAPLDAADAD